MTPRLLNVIGYRVGLVAMGLSILLCRWDLLVLNTALVVLNKMILAETR